MPSFTLHFGNCLDVLPTLDECSVDSCLCDPPYELNFMQLAWDRRGVAFDPDTWRAVYRVLKPGAMLLAFGGARTYHRLACAIENAGFEIIDGIVCFVHGQGFPKGVNISKAIDNGGGCYEGKTDEQIDADVKAWTGYRSQLKPAFEPVIVAMRPVEKNFATNAMKHGVAGFNVDGARIATTDIVTTHSRGVNEDANFGNGVFAPAVATNEERTGRYPANVIFQHHEDCEYIGPKNIAGSSPSVPNAEFGTSGGGIYNTKTGEGRDVSKSVGYNNVDGTETVQEYHCHEECPVRLLGEQSGVSKATDTSDSERAPYRGVAIYGGGRGFSTGEGTVQQDYGDTGTAARFFYCPKPAKSEKNIGCEHLFWRVEATGQFSLISESEYKELPNTKRATGNIHATVKSIKLLEYLCTLTRTPTGGIVLDPFCGSGSTGVAAMLADRDFIGIESDPNAHLIAECRLREVIGVDAPPVIS